MREYYGYKDSQKPLKGYNVTMAKEKDFQLVGKRLKELRLSKNMTQADVAKKAGISTNHYATIERGETASAVSLSNLRKILNALKAKSAQVLSF